MDAVASTPEIRRLSPSVINKIAAGEVIERPASVVKELVENAVDSGATRIDVTLAGGGMELVRVCDNGCGIAIEQLSLAVAPHATSKIRDADDLFRVGTLGFRGEALASIAEISQLTLRSRCEDSQVGAELTVDGGQMSEVAPCGAPVGTTIEVRNVFFNTPVRRKFMRSTPTEMGHCSEAFTRIALAWPGVHFTLRHGERLVVDLPPAEDWRERIGAFFGSELQAGLIPLDSSDEEIALRGYAADPQHSRGNNRMQYLFLNGRHIRDRSLQHALGEAYRGLLLTGRYPIAFLHLSMPPDAVDVNVHPTKLEVRFADSGRLYSQLLGTLRKKFLTTDLTAQVRSHGGPDAGLDPAELDAHRRELVAWAKGELAAKGAVLDDPATPAEPADPQGRLDLQFRREMEGGLQLNRIERETFATSAQGMPATEDSVMKPQAEATSYEALQPVAQAFAQSAPSSSQIGFQIHNRYLVTESREGMVVIDQHALHERILYEQFKAKVFGKTLETQRLLVPEAVTLPPAEAAAVIEAREVLAELGLHVEPFGGDTVLVTSYPAMLANVRPAELLKQVIDMLITEGKTLERRDLLDEMLHMMSCKAAVKAGDPLAPEEITALLEQRAHYQDTHHCPHGRPTALVFTREELDKRFKRI
jgi:DNA mismatch repair protein MutL